MGIAEFILWIVCVNRLNLKFGPTMLIETLPTLDLVLL